MPSSDPADTVRRFLGRSETFASALADCFPEASIEVPDEEPAVGLAVAACLLSIEHASVVRGAFSSGAPNSGSAVLRMQYEALLRSAWVLFAASPGHVEKLCKELDTESEMGAKNLPGTKEMLSAVEKHAPGPVARNLADFHVHNQHALNSFPVVQLLQLLAISNGLLINAFQMLAAISGSVDLAERVRSLHGSFQDCLPELRAP